MALAVRPISSAEHLAFVASRPSASFLQCPSWATVKSEWGSESLGWYDDAGDPAALLGAGLVLLRQVPKVRKFLAYLPEGPVLDWAADGARGPGGRGCAVARGIRPSAGLPGPRSRW